MKKGPFVVGIVFAAFAFFGILLSTSFFTNWSESALMSVAIAILSGGAGIVGAKFGNPSTGKAIGFGILFSILVNILLFSFFSIIWPKL